MTRGAEHYPFIPQAAAPPRITRTEGNYLIPADGDPILDAGGGAICTNIGHGRREVAQVAARSLGEVDYVIPPWPTDARVALRDRLVEHWLPDGLTRVGLMSGGSEAVDSALRLARAHHVSAGRESRWKMVGRSPSYHGATIATLSVGGHVGRRAGFEPLFPDFGHVPWDDADALDHYIEAEGPDTIAAFIGEPVIGASGGGLTPGDDYWPRVAEICRRHGVLFIADEVMTGFGRTGTRFAVEHWGVTPDILVGGKGMSGGYAPITGIYASEEVLAPLAEAGTAFMFFTYGAHSSSCAIADKVLEIMQREHLVAVAAAQGEILRSRLEELTDHPHVEDVRGLGLLQGIGLVKDKANRTDFPASAAFNQAVVAEALARNVWVYPAGAGEAAQDAILLGPPFTISEDEIDTIVRVLRASIDAAADRFSGS